MPITYTQARDAIVTHVDSTLKTHLAALPVFWENTTEVDPVTVGSKFLQAEVDIEDAVLASTSNDLFDHVTGTIGFRLFLKSGVGTRVGLQIWDTLNEHVRHQTLGSVHLGTPTPGRKELRDGWLSMELSVPFEYWTV